MIAFSRLALTALLPLWTILCGSMLLGADEPVATFSLSSVLLFIAAGYSVTSKQKISAWFGLAFVAYIALFSVAYFNTWLDSGGHEYAALAATGGVLYVGKQAASGSTKSTETIWAALTLSGGVLAAICLFDYAYNPNEIFGISRPYGEGRFSAPFLSANTSATFFMLFALISTAEILRQERRLGGTSFSTMIRVGLQKLALPFAVLGLSLTCVFLSGSRAGITICAVGCFSLLVWNRLASPRDQKRKFGPLSILYRWAGVFLIVGFFLIFGELYQQRLSELSGSGRELLYSAYLEAVELSPIIGGGLGSFQFTNDIIGRADNALQLQAQGAAHNLMLQWLLQVGIPASLVFGLLSLLLCRSFIVGLGVRRHQKTYLRTVTVAYLCVMTHGLFDYALEIPAVCWLFAYVLGVGFGISARKGYIQPRSYSGRIGYIVFRSVLALFFLSAAFWSILGARDRLIAESLQTSSPDDILELAASDLPRSRPAYWYDRFASRLLEVSPSQARIAVAALERSLAREPRDGHVWMRLAWAKYLANNRFDSEIEYALRISYDRLPYAELDYRRWRLGFGEGVWFSLTPDTQSAILREARLEQERWVRENLTVIATQLGYRD